MGHTIPHGRSLRSPVGRIGQEPVESRSLLVSPWPLQSRGTRQWRPSRAGRRIMGLCVSQEKGGSRKMPASAGEVALEPVFPLFSSGKTVKA